MSESIQGFVADHWFNTGIILVVAYLSNRFAMAVIAKLIRRTIRYDHFRTPADEKQREETLVGIVRAGLRVCIWVIAGILLLGEIGLNIAPLLAGASIAGVALGFGAQFMVKDFLAGLFIAIENQYRVGDVVQINQGVAGVVEHVTLRETVLRDLDGMVHHIPNGNVTVATNMTMEYANVNLDIGVDYATDLDHLEKIINKVGLELAGDEEWKSRITEPPEFLRVEDFAESAMIVKIVGKTAPMEHWAVTGELRRRLKKAFDKEGVIIPYPQRVIHKPKS